MNLQNFGHRLRTLRTATGYTQDQLIGSLQLLMATAPNEAYRELDAPLISRWEGGSARSKRKWRPTRPYMINLITLFADQLTPQTARQWAIDCGYTISTSELASHVPDLEATAPAPAHQRIQQQPPLPDDYINRSGLEQALWGQLGQQQMVALFGLGGTGKTTLATWAAHKLANEQERGVIWVDDCRGKDGAFQVFEAQERIASALSVDLPKGSLAERAGALRTLLQHQSYLIILDDVWPSDDLEHLRVQSQGCPVLITTRNATVAHRLGPTQPISVNGMTPEQGRALLATPQPDEGAESELLALLSRVGHLPLALSLIKMLLQEGYRVSELLAEMQADDSALEILALEDQPNRATNLQACFDLSYNHLSKPQARQRLAQLGCFSGAFATAAAAAVWGLAPTAARRHLDALARLSLVQRVEGHYRLPRLLRDYARHQLKTDWPEQLGKSYGRHAAFYLRQRLAHPQILADVTDAAPMLDNSWLHIREAMHWAVDHAPALAASATLLAHTERAALREIVGPPLLAAINPYVDGLTDRATQALFLEICGDLHLLQQENDAALATFAKAESLWLTLEDTLASGRAKLRQAGIHLLNENPSAAAETAGEAQVLLTQSLPLSPQELPTARRLFYWFDLLYAALVRWPSLPQDDVASLAELAAQTGDDALTARGYHIYRMWCTTPAHDRSAQVRALGRELADKAIHLWRAVGEEDKSDQEELWSEYQLTNRCPPHIARRFATRLSNTAPQLGLDQLSLLPHPGLSWWLQTPETERIDWLATMLPRYFNATDSAEPPLGSESQERQWVREIIGQTSSLRRNGRRLPMASPEPPEDHFLNAPEWRVFSGQRSFSLVDEGSAAVVQQMVGLLDAELTVVADALNK